MPVRDLRAGFAQGVKDAGADAVADAKQTVTHPLATAKDIGHAVSHPVATGKNVASEIKEETQELKDAIKRRDGYAVGHAAGYSAANVGISVAGGAGAAGAARAVTTGTRIVVGTEKLADRVTVTRTPDVPQKQIAARPAETPAGPFPSIPPGAPRNLKEQLAMKQAQSNPSVGRALDIKLNDPRWPASAGWEKMSQRINDVEVHYVRNKNTGATADFKIK